MSLSRHQQHLALALLLIVVIIATGTYLRLRNQQYRALRQSMATLTSAATFHTDSELKLNLPPRLRGRERPLTQITLQLTGDVQRSSGTPEVTGKLYVDARGRGNIFFADGDIRVLTDAVAFHLENVPVLLNPSGRLMKKWTYVSVPTMTTNNPAAVSETVHSLGSVLQYRGRETQDGKRMYHFSGTLSSEDEQRVADIFRQSNSGNRALHVLTRLLDAHNVKSIDVWVDARTKQFNRWRVEFVRPLQAGGEFPFATLTLTFSDFGKAVTIERPPEQATVQPHVFSKLFGTGEPEAITEDKISRP